MVALPRHAPECSCCAAPDPPAPGVVPATLDEIIGVVCVFYGVKREDIYRRRGAIRVGVARAVVVAARHDACWLARQHTQMSYPEIGRALSKHHTTIMAAVVKIGRQARESYDTRARLAELERRLRNALMRRVAKERSGQGGARP